MEIHPLDQSQAQIFQRYLSLQSEQPAQSPRWGNLLHCNHEASAAGLCSYCRAPLVLSCHPGTCSLSCFLQDNLVRLTSLPSSLVSLRHCIQTQKEYQRNTKHRKLLRTSAGSKLLLFAVISVTTCSYCDDCCRLFGLPCADVGTRMVQQIQAFSPVNGCEKCHYSVSFLFFYRFSGGLRVITFNFIHLCFKCKGAETFFLLLFVHWSKYESVFADIIECKHCLKS